MRFDPTTKSRSKRGARIEEKGSMRSKDILGGKGREMAPWERGGQIQTEKGRKLKRPGKRAKSRSNWWD